MIRWQGVLELAIFLFAVAFLVALLDGCKPVEPKTAEQIRNGAVVAQYDQMLAKCQESAMRLPQPEQFTAYIRCEKALSRSLCEESPELRETWARCKEVLP
jgi:hypothetical protein